jgi:beta-1,4-mannosyltransferase
MSKPLNRFLSPLHPQDFNHSSNFEVSMHILAQPAFKNRQFNPYNWLLYTQIQQLGVTVSEFSPRQLLQRSAEPRVWHLHWPDLFLKSPQRSQAWLKTQMLLRLMDLAHWQGIQIVWTVHNLGSHEQLYPQLEARFWPAFIRRLNGYFSLTQTGMTAAQERFPQLRSIPGFVVPHGHYRQEYSQTYPQTTSRAAARQQLGLDADAEVILSFGRIRTYKNVPHLVRTFKELSQDLSNTHTQLLVAGLPEASVAEELAALRVANDARIHWHLDFISEAMTPLYFQAADLVVLPYREILNSGGALLALSLNCPVLVPHKGSLGELQASVGAEWVRTYSGELNPEILQTALDWARTTPREPVAPLEAFNWQQIARQTVAAYESLCQVADAPPSPLAWGQTSHG